MDKDLQDAATEFLSSFEAVFDSDWSHTKHCIERSDNRYINGTFISPDADDESDDSGNRGKLLEAYRRFKIVLQERR